MKNISKKEIFLFVCLMLGFLLSMITQIIEVTMGIEVIWLNFLTLCVLFTAVVPIIVNYIVDVIKMLKEEIKENKKKNKLNKKM